MSKINISTEVNINKNSTSMFDKIINAFEIYLKDVKSGKAADIISDYIIEKVQEDVKDIFNYNVEKYYASYSPRFYKRTNSFYKAYKINSTGDSIHFESSEDLIPQTHRVSSEYIYDKMFWDGWHGGADKGPDHPSVGTPYYRTPIPPIAKRLGIPAYSMWAYGAVRTISPAGLIIQDFDDYNNGGSPKSTGGVNLEDRAREGLKLLYNSYEFFSLIGMS